MQITKVFTEWNISCKKHIARKFVKFPGKLTGMKVDKIIPPFKFVELFKNNDGNYNVIFFKIVNALVIMKQNVGIYNKKFFIVFSFHF